jgi:hypothetical protein
MKFEPSLRNANDPRYAYVLAAWRVAETQASAVSRLKTAQAALTDIIGRQKALIAKLDGLCGRDPKVPSLCAKPTSP